MRRAAFVAALPLVVAIVVAGCGGSSKTTAKTSGASSGYGSGSGSTTSGASAASAAVITTKHGKLGTVLAYGEKRLTVYLFENDKGGTSKCTGACASVWPPVTGNPKAAGGAVASNLGTITRAGGAKQVTYKGHPLYLYVKDKDAGDTYGQGIKAFGAGWYVLRPSGQKVDSS